MASLFYVHRKSPCRSCRRLRSFDLAFKKQDQKIAACGSSYRGAPITVGCGTIAATFSHTRIDHTHDRPPYTQTCA
ncbi:hypothetical protein CGA21_09770 [Pseudomonas sp. PSB11]|nr:hypothetical protein [Pseudomonas sp. PSB11]